MPRSIKRPIPRYATRVGIVTSPTGAAVRDIIQIARRRNPYVELILYPALVQGEGAVASVIFGIRALDAMGLDVLIVGRGGGSIEELWAFNEEEVAREIFGLRHAGHIGGGPRDRFYHRGFRGGSAGGHAL